MADLLWEEIKEHPEAVSFAGNYREYLRNKKEGKLSAFLTVEEGAILESQLERLEILYQKGIRLITLTWNFENCIGFPNAGWKYQDRGLKAFGIETLERMDELGIIADVSHLSDGGFEDVYRYGKRPFIATHSNARSICGHERNLTDEMIRKLAQKGGVTGLNLSGAFLQENGKSTLEAMLIQMRHIMNVGGKEVLCLGTDFDGVSDLGDIQECGQMPYLAAAMESAGFTENEIDGICYKNAEKFMKNYWGE
ncbi:MAG TPA: peptidase M19 [Lachnospiraceae bacterium]|nr:peptidase M19 [Lachnospiraceae bacterium]